MLMPENLEKSWHRCLTARLFRGTSVVGCKTSFTFLHAHNSLLRLIEQGSLVRIKPQMVKTQASDDRGMT